MPAPLAEWLHQQAKRLGRSKSDLVREALERERNGGQQRPGCGDLLSGLDGFFDGPRDLSTNPKHMDGFGK